jgi:hypothetical protein
VEAGNACAMWDWVDPLGSLTPALVLTGAGDWLLGCTVSGEHMAMPDAPFLYFRHPEKRPELRGV